jgi:tetratricopeptide (TPR) repeat protein
MASEVVWEADEERGVHALPAALATPSSVDFVGRVAERERLATAWKDAATGRRRVVLISGEPGVGKTRLAAELARVAHDEGAIVLFGRCDEDLGVPYQPFVEALDLYVASCPPDDLAHQVAPHGGDIARLVPQLADRVPGLPDSLRADPETERYRLFTAITSFLGRIVEGAPVVLVLDDLHWAAKPTLLLLRHLARADWSGPLLVVGTYRDTDLGRTHPLAEMLADLRRESDVERLALHGLDAEEVEEFVAHAAGHTLDDEGTELARMLYDETEGNPFFMGQVLRHLVETGAIIERDGRWARGAALDELGIPEGVREVVGRRLAHLEPTTNDVLAAAAVIGRDFDRDVLTAVTDADSEAVLDALEEAETARLISAADDRAGRFGFVHALVRSTLYDEIPTTRRLRLHKRIGEALEHRDVDAHLDELAHHFAEAAALGEAGKAVEYGRRAAARAIDRVAYEEAIVDLERVLAGLDPTEEADRRTRAEVLVDLARVVWTLGGRTQARGHLDEAAALADELDLPELLAEAGLVRGGGVRGWVEAGSREPDIIAMLEKALPRLPADNEPLRARVLARLSRELYFDPEETARRNELIEDALAIARRLDDPATLAFVLNAAYWALFNPDNYDDRTEVVREVVALSLEVGDRRLEATARSYQISNLIEVGAIAEAKAEVARLRAVSDELRQGEVQWSVLVHEGAFATFEGRLDEASRLTEEALEVGQQAEIESAFQMAGVAQIAIGRLRGGVEDVVPLIEAMVEQWPLIPAWRAGLAYCYYLLGQREEAREQFDIMSADWETSLPYDGNWLVGHAVIATVCHFVDDKEQAAVLYDNLKPYEGFVVQAGLPADILGSAHRFLMLLAATLERWDDMERHATEALARNQALGSPPWHASTQLDLGRILGERGRPGDPERARALLDECLATCDEIGMSYLAEQAQAVVARL